METRLTRSRLLRAAAGGAAALALAPGAALAARARAPHLYRLAVRNPGRRYLGDRRLFATVSPSVPGRDAAKVAFQLDRAGKVKLEAVRTALRSIRPVWTVEYEFAPGRHELEWKPDPALPPGSYVMRLSVEDGQGLRRVYGGKRPSRPERGRSPVIRLLSVEAMFERRSYAAGQPMQLTILTDARALNLEILRCGPEDGFTDRNDEMRGLPVGPATTIDWRRNRGQAATITVPSGPWISGVYAAKLTTDDGRVGFAPIVIRPPTLGTVREAVVMPTNTWQAYNFYDEDGDGWGDTWYAGGSPPVDLRRPYRERGVPPRWRRYDVAFQRWLVWNSRTPDQLADDDLEAFASGDDLRKLYDLVVFPGHSEYMTQHAYDVLERYRDLGGRMIFLSSNNFFWRVSKHGNTMRRVKRFRDLGKPEARVLGVQYKGNDNGSKQGVYYVIDTDAAPWLFAGTGLKNGMTLGESVGGYGIEVDGTTPDSPPGTKVLALIPSLFGPGLHAEMAYYETEAGARVFSAGVLDFCGSVVFWPQRRLLENVWRHMTS
jgi:hypothetical protein